VGRAISRSPTEAESAIAVARAQHARWTVTVELLELSRIPETDDVLGSFEAQLPLIGAPPVG